MEISEARKRHILCYGTITVAVCAGVVARTMYLAVHEGEFKGKPHAKILTFHLKYWTQIDQINDL